MSVPAPLDIGAHGVEAVRQVDHLRLGRRVDQLRITFRQCRRHHQILGCADGDLREHNLCPGQAVRRGGINIAGVQRDDRAHLLQPLAVQIDRPRTDGATAGQRDLGLTGTRQQRAEYEYAGPHLAYKIVRRRGVDDLPCRQLHHVPAMWIVRRGRQCQFPRP